MSHPAPSILSDYPGSRGVWDEMVSADGSLRPHYHRLAATLNRLGPDGLAACADQARHLIADNGITYNVHSDPRGMDRPWEFDPVPFVIPSHEWAELEKGLIQRARLINAVLTDLYGPQRLLRDGALPPGVVLGNPGYQFACHNIRPQEDTWLHLYGVDLARGPDGRWWCFADRTQTPTGSGYVLENRIVLSRCLPDDIRDLHVQRLANFYRIFRDNLYRIAPNNVRPESPRIVLLTPGPTDETYFEHAYLSRYLGLPLVEGGDLTVRDRKVFIKTLQGLQPVDVILRRVADHSCDPLELRQDSFFGVPGLLEAMRAGNVCVANPVGAGLAESPALLAFLPSLCRRVLGEEMILPNSATWWCGQRKERDHVLANLDTFLIKGAYSDRDTPPIFPGTLSSRDREALVAKIQKSPHNYVGQEQLALSEAPIWTGQKLTPQPVALRVYLAAAGDRFVVMPGGLTRASVSPNIPIVAMQSGGGSKDTWVLSDGPVHHQSLLTPASLTRFRQPAVTELPSRVADSLFWLGRYAERSEILVRVMRVLVNELTAEAYSDNPRTALLLMRLLVPLEILEDPSGVVTVPESPDRTVLRILLNKDHPAGLHSCLGNLRRIAWMVRDRLSLDTWRILTELQQLLPADGVPRQLDDALRLLNRLIRGLAAFSGMSMENMTRSHGWRFLDLGRRFDRAASLLHLVRGTLIEDPAGRHLLLPLLDIADSTMTYRRRYFADPQRDAVLAHLLHEDQNPRSALFQLLSIADHLAHLPSIEGRSEPGLKHRLISDLTSHLRALNPESPPDSLTVHLERLTKELYRLSDRIVHVYFSHAGARIS